MILSQTCQIAIKALIAIAAQQKERQNVHVKILADEIQENVHTIAKVLQLLVKKNMAGSVKGPLGGFYLTPAHLQNSLLQVVEAVDGDTIFKNCILGLSTCSSTKPCPLHNRFNTMRETLHTTFKEVRIDELWKINKKGKVFLFN